MSNWNEEQDDSNLQSTIKVGDGALEELRKLWEALKNAGKKQADEAEQLIEESKDLAHRSSTWLTVVIFITVSLLATPTKAQDLPQVPPTPTIGEPARIERVYLPLVMAGETVDANVNWNSGIHAAGAWQARGN